MSELRKLSIHRALHRPDHLAGAERELVLLTGLLTLVMIVVVMTMLSAIIGIFLWIFCVAALRSMAKADPIMSKVYLRHIKYQNIYPARSSFFAPESTFKRSI